MACNGVLDTTLSFNMNTKFRNAYVGLINQLAKNTDFNAEEITCLLKIFSKFFKSFKTRSIDIRSMYSWFALFGIMDEFIITQILKYLNYDPYKGYVDPGAWINLSEIFFNNNIKQQIKYAFEIYDFKDAGYLTLLDVTQRVHNFFNTPDEEENEEMRMDMALLLFQKFDLDLDGTISFEEYQNVVLANPLLLECFGRCLPSPCRRKRLVLMQNMLGKIGMTEQVIPYVLRSSHTNGGLMKYKSKLSRAKRKRSSASDILLKKSLDYDLKLYESKRSPSKS